MKIKNLLKNIIILILIIVLIEIGYSKFISKEYPLNLFGLSFLVVTTGSMEPIIDSGELIVIAEYDKYFENDIVTYLDEDGFLITHRIIKINENKMITRGDNNNLNDPEIDIEKIKGKLIFHSKILGFFVLYILKPLIVIYLILLIIINFINFKIRERRNEEDENKQINEKNNS